MSQRSSSPESDFAKPGAITIKCISNAGHSIIGHKSMGTYPARAIIRCHVDSCPSSPPESKNVSSDGISCVLLSYVIRAYFIIMTLNYFVWLIWCIKWNNVHIVGIYLFPLHQHTAMRNITIQRQYLCIIPTQKTFKDEAVSEFVRSW